MGPAVAGQYDSTPGRGQVTWGQRGEGGGGRKGRGRGRGGSRGCSRRGRCRRWGRRVWRLRRLRRGRGPGRWLPSKVMGLGSLDIARRMALRRRRGAHPGAAEDAGDLPVGGVDGVGVGIAGLGQYFADAVGEVVGGAHNAGQAVAGVAVVRQVGEEGLEAAAGRAQGAEVVPVDGHRGGGVAGGAGQGSGGGVVVAGGGVAGGEFELAAGLFDVVGRRHFRVPSPLIGGWMRVRGVGSGRWVRCGGAVVRFVPFRSASGCLVGSRWEGQPYGRRGYAGALRR